MFVCYNWSLVTIDDMNLLILALILYLSFVVFCFKELTKYTWLPNCYVLSSEKLQLGKFSESDCYDANSL